MENNYYIYFHINPLYNKVFYVGKGKDKRAWSNRNRNQYWNNTVNKYGYIVDIFEDNLTEDEAFQREKFYINKIGRTNLVNLTDGGEGQSGNKNWLGKKHTDEARKKCSETKIGNKNPLGTIRSEETKKKMSESLKGKKNALGSIRSEETKLKMSEAKKLYWQSKKSL